MAEKTAVDWLFEQIQAEWASTKYAFDAYQQAKEMQKEQIMNAFSKGQEKESIMGFYDRGEKYYNETFGK